MDNLSVCFTLKPIGRWTVGEGLPRLFNIVTDIGQKIDWSRLSVAFQTLFQALGLSMSIGRVCIVHGNHRFSDYSGYHRWRRISSVMVCRISSRIYLMPKKGRWLPLYKGFKPQQPGGGCYNIHPYWRPG